MNAGDYKPVPTLATVVRVCPDRDVECGDNANTWCKTCPKRKTVSFAVQQAMKLNDMRVGDKEFVLGKPVRVEPDIVDGHLVSFSIVDGPVDPRLANVRLFSGVGLTCSPGDITTPNGDAPTFTSRIKWTDPASGPLKAHAYDRIAEEMRSPDRDGILARIQRIIDELKEN